MTSESEKLERKWSKDPKIAKKKEKEKRNLMFCKTNQSSTVTANKVKRKKTIMKMSEKKSENQWKGSIKMFLPL